MDFLRSVKKRLLQSSTMTGLWRSWGGLILLAARFNDFCIGEYNKSKLKSCGVGVELLQGVTLFCPGTISIGDHTWIGHFSHLRGGGEVSIGKYCQIANNVIIASGNHVMNGSLYQENNEFRNITIEDNVWIASNAIILAGVRIGRNSAVAAGAVVTKDVPENTLVAGVPARPIKTISGREALANRKTG